MRILSSFHDYYDCVQATGQDRALIYQREPFTEEPEVWPFPKIFWDRNPLSVSRTVWLVGFCGLVYPVVRFTTSSVGRFATPEYSHIFCFSLEDIDAFVGTFEEDVQGDYRAKNYRGLRKNARWPFHGCRFKWVEWLTTLDSKKSQYEGLFRDKKAPIWVARQGYSGQPGEITWNGALKPLEFYRVFDPYRAFQEISMYLGGVLGVDALPIPKVSNDDLVQAKGFDLKTSFRKPKKEK